MRSAVERIQSKEEVAGDGESLVGLVCLAAVHAHVCSQLGVDKKLTKTVLDLHHKVCYQALLCITLPCPALPCPALPCPALPCPALPCSQSGLYSCHQEMPCSVLFRAVRPFAQHSFVHRSSASCPQVCLLEQAAICNDVPYSQSQTGMSGCAGQLSLPLSLPCSFCGC